ncbi:5295_t:CDS:2 [Ambispora leptoticha]|uniref:5295_t:CDS:1 n=1 Tax=Ambispora leptoticha TaxID=144679 RepID=A0A9N9F6D6_9GLOM|nr:5295_t:CDS:2 [Ambispora leptoticha]
MSALKYLLIFAIFAFCTLTSVVGAQSSTSTSSSVKPTSSYLCGSAVFDQCYNFRMTNLKACSPADNACNCDALNALIDCYYQCTDATIQSALPNYVSQKNDACSKVPTVSQTWTPTSTSAAATSAVSAGGGNTEIPSAISKPNGSSSIYNNDQYIFVEKLLLAITAIAFCLAF